MGRFLIGLILLLTLLNPDLSVTGQRPAQQDDLDARVEAILAQLSVEERVGQLFMVSFVGQNATPADAISELIRDYKIGGVVSIEINNNNAEDTVAQVATLTNQL